MTKRSHHEVHPSPGEAWMDAAVTSTRRGLWAIKWSFIGLLLTAVLQMFIVVLSGSVGLLADTIHNIGDASTALPLWVAFLLARWKPNRRFSYGYGRVEDLAGVIIVLTILFSAIVAGYESVQRLIHPRPVTHLGAVALASLLGFVGNEAVAIFRLRVGKEIGSAALIADGLHARIDGWTSLAVLAGAVGVWLGYPMADPLVGLLITLAILGIVWQSGKSIFTRLLDGVEPDLLERIRVQAGEVEGVEKVAEVRARWIGHRLQAEVNIAVSPDLSVLGGHTIAKQVHHRLLEKVRFLSSATIHVDPLAEVGERFHARSSPAEPDTAEPTG